MSQTLLRFFSFASYFPFFALDVTNGFTEGLDTNPEFVRQRQRLQRVLGCANEYKEGDEAQGLAALDETTRLNARALVRNTSIASFLELTVFEGW